VGLVHWDDAEWHRRAKGEMDAEWQFLGRAGGAQAVGVNRVRVAPGKLPTPPHSHGASEELYYVLGGSGLAWQDDAVHEVRPGTCVIHRADEMEHTFVAGPDGLEYLVFATTHPTELGWLPRSRAVRFGWPWVEGRTDDPWDVEAGVEPLAYGEPQPTPANIVHLDDAEVGSERHETWRVLADRERSRQAGMGWSQIDPGHIGSVPHCHSEEEEVFVILDGDAQLELWPTPVPEAHGAKREDVPVRAGHVICRPPGTRIAHAFRAGANGVTMLVYGTRRPNDIAYYPRSGKIFLRGVGLMTRVESLDYYDGEPDE
jgi:uncharacterized cupin superfamily protein